MPDWIQALLSGLINICSTVAGRVMVALGFSTVTFTGINSSIGWLKDMAVGSLTGIPATAIAILSTLNVGIAISLIVSAILVRMLLTGLFNSATKVWTMGLFS